jgi:hypothetical protein
MNKSINLSLESAWQQIQVDWAGMNKSALNNSDTTSWDLAQWKVWLQFYQTVLQDYAQISGTNSSGNATLFWKPEFDNETLTEVMLALNQSGQLGQFLSFFDEFFGP